MDIKSNIVWNICPKCTNSLLSLYQTHAHQLVSEFQKVVIGVYLHCLLACFRSSLKGERKSEECEG
jgi:hypothetical protein